MINYLIVIQLMAWHQVGEWPLSEPKMFELPQKDISRQNVRALTEYLELWNQFDWLWCFQIEIVNMYV